MEFLYLSEEDMIRAGVKDMPRCIDVMEDTFRLLCRGDYRLGGANNDSHGLRTRFPAVSDIPDMPLDAPGRWFTAMPAYLGGDYHCFGIKTYGANQENWRHGMPRSVLMMQLLDVETGAPLAFMSANVLSAMRTGAVSGLYARHFAPRETKKVAVIGPGVIGRYSLDAVMAECPSVEAITIHGRGKASREAFMEHCAKEGYANGQVVDCATVDEACCDADVIITANTQAPRFADYPLIRREVVKQGACIVVSSAARMDRSFLEDGSCVLVADDRRMYAGNRGIDAQPVNDEERKSVTVKGALHEALSDGREILDLPKVVSDKSFARTEGTTYFCASGGIPIEDVSWAYECYQMAKKLGVGTSLSVWAESSL